MERVMIPSYVVKEYDTAQELYAKHDFAGAAKICFNLLTGNSNSEDLNYFMSAIARQRGNLHAALHSAFKAHLINNNSVKNLIALSEISYDMGDYEQALIFVEAAKKIDSGHLRIIAIQVRINLKLKLIDVAETYLAEYEKRDVAQSEKDHLRLEFELQKTWLLTACKEQQLLNKTDEMFKIVSDCLSTNEKNYLIVKAQSSKLLRGTIIGHDQLASISRETRRANILSLNITPESKKIYESVYTAVLKTSTDLGVKLSGPAGPLQLTEYLSTELGFYDWHIDTGIGAYKKRAISISILLSNSNDFTGGELILLIDGKLKPMQLSAGDAVIFKSNTQHCVSEVRNGIRYSLVGWFDVA